MPLVGALLHPCYSFPTIIYIIFESIWIPRWSSNLFLLISIKSSKDSRYLLLLFFHVFLPSCNFGNCRLWYDARMQMNWPSKRLTAPWPKKSTSTKERHGQRTTSDRVPTRKSYWCWEPPRFQQILNGGYLLHHHRGKQLGSLWLFKGVLEGMWDYASQCGCFVIKFMEDSCKSSLKPIFCFHVFNQSYLSTQDAWGTCFWRVDGCLLKHDWQGTQWQIINLRFVVLSHFSGPVCAMDIPRVVRLLLQSQKHQKPNLTSTLEPPRVIPWFHEVVLVLQWHPDRNPADRETAEDCAETAEHSRESWEGAWRYASSEVGTCLEHEWWKQRQMMICLTSDENREQMINVD